MITYLHFNNTQPLKFIENKISSVKDISSLQEWPRIDKEDIIICFYGLKLFRKMRFPMIFPLERGVPFDSLFGRLSKGLYFLENKKYRQDFEKRKIKSCPEIRKSFDFPIPALLDYNLSSTQIKRKKKEADKSELYEVLKVKWNSGSDLEAIKPYTEQVFNEKKMEFDREDIIVFGWDEILYKYLRLLGYFPLKDDLRNLDTPEVKCLMGNYPLIFKNFYKKNFFCLKTKSFSLSRSNRKLNLLAFSSPTPSKEELTYYSQVAGVPLFDQTKDTIWDLNEMLPEQNELVDYDFLY